jgi:NAD(P)-dependent dehydrogenase (short-subunit alcohol dehydrogenase family)
MLDLTGKAAIVTGAAMGIGRGVAVMLAHAGASIVVADINLEAARKVVGEIEALAGKALAIEADVSKAVDVKRMVEVTVDKFGGVDILVNNAGIIPLTPALELEEEEWDRVQDVNVKGTFLCSQAVAREMVKQGRGGKIVNMGSIDGVYPLMVGFAHYDTSKAAVIMLTKSLSKELAPHKINVNAVAPGIVDTPALWRLADPLGLDPNVIFSSRIPLGRLEQPEDVAKAVLFLVSDAAEYITGICLFVEGGFLVG